MVVVVVGATGGRLWSRRASVACGRPSSTNLAHLHQHSKHGLRNGSKGGGHDLLAAEAWRRLNVGIRGGSDAN